MKLRQAFGEVEEWLGPVLDGRLRKQEVKGTQANTSHVAVNEARHPEDKAVLCSLAASDKEAPCGRGL